MNGVIQHLKLPPVSESLNKIQIFKKYIQGSFQFAIIQAGYSIKLAFLETSVPGKITICIKVYSEVVQPIKGNNCELIQIKLQVRGSRGYFFIIIIFNLICGNKKYERLFVFVKANSFSFLFH